MVRLPMHVHQGFTYLRLHTQADCPPVHSGDRPPFSPNFPSKPKSIRLLKQPFAVQQFVDYFTLRSFQAEKTFHDRPLSAFANAGRIHPRAKDRPQRIQDDGLASACLTSEDDQSGGKLECQVLNDCKISNAQFFQHIPSKT